ncbi:hypothetical protein DPMN_145992, partial [Dreissena polymorpha]
RVFLDEYVVLQRREAIEKDPELLMRGADLSSVQLEVFKDCPGLYETLPTVHITSLNITKIEHTDLLSQTLPHLNHLQQLRICLNKYDMEMKLPECIKYVFIIYKKVSPSSLQQYVNNLSTIKHGVQCKLLFRVEENDDEYTRIKQDVCELKSVNVQHFEIVNNKGTARRAAALTLSATADDCDDDYDKRLLRWEGEYVDSKPWIHYCKIRLNILYTDACGRCFQVSAARLLKAARTCVIEPVVSKIHKSRNDNSAVRLCSAVVSGEQHDDDDDDEEKKEEEQEDDDDGVGGESAIGKSFITTFSTSECFGKVALSTRRNLPYGPECVRRSFTISCQSSLS